MEYNSDFDVRLSTLGALGGDTAKTYDSVYDIDLAILDAIEHGGGGGGLNYNQIKELLASSGVTEIVVNGDGESITIDYDLLSQIGQGGGDYRCIDSVDALSGITSPKDGSLAYVAGKGVWKYFAHTGITSWLPYDVYLDSLTAAEINTMCANIVSYLQYGYLPTITVKLFQYNETAAHITGAQQYRLQPFGESAFGGGGGQIQGEIVFSNVCFAQDAQAYINSTFLPKIFYTTFQKVNNVWSEVSSGDTGYRGFKNLATDEYVRWVGENRTYRIVNSLDEVSGMTNPRDGMFVYLKEHTGLTSATTVEVDYYDLNAWLIIEADYGNDIKARFSINHEGGVCVSFNSSGHFIFNNDGWIWNVLDNLGNLPADFIYDNGIEGTYVSRVSGDTYEQYGDWKDTVIFYPLNGVIPSISVFPEEGSVEMVSSASTSGDITVTIPAKGMWKYYADVNQWLPYNINWDALREDEKDTIVNQIAQYEKPTKCYRSVNSYGNSIREFNAVPFKTDWEHPDFVNNINFFGIVSREPSAEIKLPTFSYNWDGEQQKYVSGDLGWENIERAGDGRRALREVVQIPNANSEYATVPSSIYNIPISGVVTGTVYSTEIAYSADTTWDENCFKFYNGWSGFDCWMSIRKDGYIRTEAGSKLVIPAESSNTAEWTILNYTWHDEANNNQGAYAVAAVRMYEIAGNSYRIEMFVSLPQDGYQDMYSTEFNSEKSYTWSETSGQTMEIQPMIYSFGIINKQNRVHKFKLN